MRTAIQPAIVALIAALLPTAASGQDAVTERYGGWTLDCQRSAEGAYGCTIVNVARRADTREPVARITVEPTADGQLVVVALVPLGVRLGIGAGLRFEDDAEGTVAVPYQICQTGGCQAAWLLTEELEARFDASAMVDLLVVLGDGSETGVRYNLDGFSEALAALDARR